MNEKRWILLSPGSFFCYYNTHKNNFMKYCEIVITKDGQICMPINTSHKNILMDLIREYTGEYPDDTLGLPDLVKLSNAVCVSYEYQLLYNDFYSKEQKQAYELLLSLRLIKENITKIN